MADSHHATQPAEYSTGGGAASATRGGAFKRQGRGEVPHMGRLSLDFVLARLQPPSSRAAPVLRNKKNYLALVFCPFYPGPGPALCSLIRGHARVVPLPCGVKSDSAPKARPGQKRSGSRPGYIPLDIVYTFGPDVPPSIL